MDNYKNETNDFLETLNVPETEKQKLEAFLNKSNLKLHKAIQDKIVDIVDEIEENLDMDIIDMDTQEFAKIVTEDIFTYYY